MIYMMSIKVAKLSVTLIGWYMDGITLYSKQISKNIFCILMPTHFLEM